ncbi:DUF3192 domain-containing protein [Ferrimonas pelagia]|uniref:DUF3192 domain-containing protein n=1 Tax=Ferrimonas pelagia TaxID=1177826 RepID=A0ABP9FEX0_9GAMM
MREQKNRIVPVILGLLGAYLLFVIITITLWDGAERTPDQLDWDDRQQHNVATIATLQMGMEQAQVLSLLGSPDFNEAFTASDGVQMQILRYRTHRLKGDGMTTEDETTPLLFRDGVLAAWGKTALAQLEP